MSWEGNKNTALGQRRISKYRLVRTKGREDGRWRRKGEMKEEQMNSLSCLSLDLLCSVTKKALS